MRCPKCHYLSFEPAPRCRNCGYDLSLSVPDLAIKVEDPPVGPYADLDLQRRDTGDAPAARDPLQEDKRSVTPTPRSPSVTAELPLFVRASPVAEDPGDEPLVSVPATPRPPLAVRRPTPDPTRLRSKYARGTETGKRAGTTGPSASIEPGLLDLDGDVQPAAGEPSLASTQGAAARRASRQLAPSGGRRAPARSGAHRSGFPRRHRCRVHLAHAADVRPDERRGRDRADPASPGMPVADRRRVSADVHRDRGPDGGEDGGAHQGRRKCRGRRAGQPRDPGAGRPARLVDAALGVAVWTRFLPCARRRTAGGSRSPLAIPASSTHEAARGLSRHRGRRRLLSVRARHGRFSCRRRHLRPHTRTGRWPGKSHWQARFPSPGFGRDPWQAAILAARIRGRS